jgi:hypothetical protein
MRFVLFFFSVVLLSSCGTAVPGEEIKTDTLPLVCELQKVQSGMRVDTTLPEIRICVKKDSTGDFDYAEIFALFNPDSCADTINIYFDKDISCGWAEYVIDSLCDGKDLRLIGQIDGQEVAIPFHYTRRFKQENDSVDLSARYYHVINIEPGIIRYQKADTTAPDPADFDSYFKAFYGNAFTPHDEINYPEREPWRQTISVLAQEGQNWDMVQMGIAPDTAAQLAAYNEFVNKLEIYDKVGVFYRLPIALMEIRCANDVPWGDFLNLLSIHSGAQVTLRRAAGKYLSDKIANEGIAGEAKSFTEEDLLLLYPDRLRWNGRMSGPTEHYYDPFHLRVNNIAPPEVKPPPVNPGHGGKWENQLEEPKPDVLK